LLADVGSAGKLDQQELGAIWWGISGKGWLPLRVNLMGGIAWGFVFVLNWNLGGMFLSKLVPGVRKSGDKQRLYESNVGDRRRLVSGVSGL